MENWELFFYLANPTRDQEVNAPAGDHLVENGGIVCWLADYEQWWALDKWSKCATKALYPAGSAVN